MPKFGTPEWLIFIGISLNLVEYFTTKKVLEVEGEVSHGGILFGTSGILTPINAKLPAVPLGPLPANIATWLAVIGLAWFVIRKVT